MKNLRLIFLAIVMSTLAGCGGGGGSSSNSTPTTVSMILKVSTTGTLSGSSISGVGFSVTMPAGVTIATNQDGSVAAGVVTPSGIISSATATNTQFYTPAGTAPAKLDIFVASKVAEGVGTGEFFSITVTRPAGSAVPTAANFTLSNFEPADLLLQPIPGINGILTVQ